MTPIVEQIHGFVDEGQGKTYGFHGYWRKDWDFNLIKIGELKKSYKN